MELMKSRKRKKRGNELYDDDYGLCCLLFDCFALHFLFFSVFFQNKINSYVKPLPFGKKCVVISKVGSFVKKGFH